MIFAILCVFCVMFREVINIMNTYIRPNLTSYDLAFLYKHISSLQDIFKIQTKIASTICIGINYQILYQF